jgi:DNA-directed RNA polymerase subunit beta
MTTAVRQQNVPSPSSQGQTALTDEEQLALVGRRNFGKIRSIMPMPNLIQVQIESFDWFTDAGLRELFEEISPITDFTGKNMELRFLDYHFGEPRYSVFECRQRDMTYAAPLRVRVQLLIKETGEIKESEIFMGDFPLMTDTGTFVINGAERVVVSQLVRSPGVYFTAAEDPNTGRQLFGAKLIPNRGAWLEFETSNKDVMSVKVDRKRKIPVSILLRAIGYGDDDQLLDLFSAINDNPDHNYVKSTIDKDGTHSQEEAVIEFYRRLRPGDPPTRDNAESLLNSLLFNPRRYDLAKVGRYKLNKRLGVDVPLDVRVLTKEDLVKIVEHMIRLNNDYVRGRNPKPDDIDHLGNRRVRAVGELIQSQFRVGLLRMERVIKERMSIQDPESASPGALINIRPVVAAMREFFGGS